MANAPLRIVLTQKSCETLDIGYNTLCEIVATGHDEQTLKSLNDAASWARIVRHISPLLRLEDDAFDEVQLELKYDVESWYVANDNRSLTSFNTPSKYTISVDRCRIEKAISSAKQLYGSDMQLWAPMLMDRVNNSIGEFWRSCRQDAGVLCH